jgi:hypothetical protein
MPHHIDSFVVASVLQGFSADSVNSPLNVDLRDNDVYEWVPAAPMQMTYCTADEEVIYQNTLFAYNYFVTHGDSTVQAVDGGALNHMDCVGPAVTNFILFFGSLQVSENNLVLTLTSDSESTAGAHNASVKVSVSGGTGYTIHWSTGSTDTLATGLSNGTYTVTVTDANGCVKVRSVSTGGQVTGIIPLGESLPRLQIFPNPAFGTLTIKATGFSPEAIAIYDITGRKVSEQGFTPQLDVSKLNRGIYTIEVKSKQATAKSRFTKM